MINSTYNIVLNIDHVFGLILSIFLLYRFVYIIVGLFFTRKFKPAKNKHKYAILIAARNEEKVIGNLLDSINKQDYPIDLVTTFVVADNCTDNTFKIAKEHGAIVYKRSDDVNKTKGFALQYLLNKIEEDYGRMSFEGYFVFDADNLLNKDYISKMNNAFDSGCKIITSYRNTKNFDENWIASTYAIHWLRSIRMNHRARSVFRLATNIQGTGFLFASEIVKDGWDYTSLTEDRALTADAVAQGYQITYQDEAEFFDEQPVSLKVALRQRLRWSKGHLQAFAQTGPFLFLNIIFGKLFVQKHWSGEKKTKIKSFKDFLLYILESIRHRFASFDTLMQVTPLVVINLVRWLIVSVVLYGLYSYVNGLYNINIFTGSTWLSTLLTIIFGNISISINPGYKAMFISMLLALLIRIIYRIGIYFSDMWIAIYVFISERKRIKKISLLKKILYIFTWPTFDIIGRYTTYVALFVKVTWKPIPHNSSITIENVKTSK